MSDFIVSARKYRPSSFSMVVGQQHITSTLKNAISHKHLAQAFLFCGPRGVGKTTCARILAKTINCTNLTADCEACNSCESCETFNNSQSLNIFELDAASNNTVDDIRSLNEQVRYAPQTGKYKIYIIDEVHMLSQSAFNAFLKTLEEPPSYAIFILATTEKHKILPTILSRCQIFDFNRIRIQDIATQLAYIASKEGIEADADALHLIAQKADGAMRDALSVFDQIVSFSGKKVTYQDVIINLNILDYDYFFNITDSVLAGNIAECLLTFNELLAKGFDGHQFLNGLSNHFRDLLVCKDQATVQLLEVSEIFRNKYKVQAADIMADQIFRLLELIHRADLSFRTAKNQKLHVEITLMQLCNEIVNTTEKKNPDLEHLNRPVAAPASLVKPQNKPVISQLSKPELPQPNTTLKSAPATAATPTLVTIPIHTPSLKVRKKEHQKAAQPPKEKLPEYEFSANELADAWETMTSNYHHAQRMNLAIALRKRKPDLHNPAMILFELDNSALVKEFEAERPAMLEFLRKTLNNFSVQLTFKVKDLNEPEDEAYTAAEKFNKMAEKNPALKKLQQQFGIEF